jgi:hypothetical protein
MLWEQGIVRRLAAAGLPELTVLGTDLEPAAVEAARAARYTAHSVQDLPPRWIERCFKSEEDDDSGRKPFELRDDATRCSFMTQDCTTALPNERFHLIVCRYAVFLYLSWEQGDAILRAMVRDCMEPGCFLVIGPSEKLPKCAPELGMTQVGPGCFQLKAAGESKAEAQPHVPDGSGWRRFATRSEWLAEEVGDAKEAVGEQIGGGKLTNTLTLPRITHSPGQLAAFLARMTATNKGESSDLAFPSPMRRRKRPTPAQQARLARLAAPRAQVVAVALPELP